MQQKLCTMALKILVYATYFAFLTVWLLCSITTYIFSFQQLLNKAMQIVNFLVVLSIIQNSRSYGSDSPELNPVEISPFYDTIIFSDVIDIMNELNKDLNPPFDDNSDSESEENIEDLLTEYQNYLDKAHEQRRIYLDKSNKTKNKVPLLRHENFVKSGMPNDYNKYSNYYAHNYYNPNTITLSPSPLSGPLDLFRPLNPTLRYFNKLDHAHMVQRKDFKGESILDYENTGKDKSLFYFPAELQKNINTPLKSSCKQCLISPNENEAKLVNIDNLKNIESTLAEQHLLEDVINKANTLNVRIRIDVQLPNLAEGKSKYNRLNGRDGALEYDDLSKYMSSNIRLPPTYLNLPIPMDVLGFKKSYKNNRHESSFHKITINKKKRSRSGNGNNKKHRKKLLTFHNIKISPAQTLKSIIIENHNSSQAKNDFSSTNVTSHENVTADVPRVDNLLSNFTSSTSTELSTPLSSTQIDESIYFMVNITNNSENETEDTQKTGNSIELDYKAVRNTTTEIPLKLREKRDTTSQNSSIAVKKTNSTSLHVISTKNKKILNILMKTNNSMIRDSELLYWPSDTFNKTPSQMKNINDLIVELENKKAKLSMTNEAIRHNRTMALEKAIFGNVDWNDVDTVAPTFISFVGKYVNGMLTFCSEKICHSMKCGNKTCVHRICTPELRFNHFGHCIGSDRTDSVVSMESIMDLPSNVVFDIVDILKDKVLGNIYGKVTLCINSKCVSFMASKKTFIKLKCSAKNINIMGHCPNIKKS